MKIPKRLRRGALSDLAGSALGQEIIADAVVSAAAAAIAAGGRSLQKRAGQVRRRESRDADVKKGQHHPSSPRPELDIGSLREQIVDDLDEELELQLEEARHAREDRGETSDQGKLSRSITDDEQQMRFEARNNDPLKQWKLSPMDIESRRRWEAYTKAKEEMLERTHIPEAPWWVVQAVDKKRARLNCIAHLLSQIPYEEAPRAPVFLPERVRNAEYVRRPVPDDMFVPVVY